MSEPLLTLKNFPLPLTIRFADKIVPKAWTSGTLQPETLPARGERELSLPRLARFAGKTGELLLGDQVLTRVVVKLREENAADKVWLVMKKSGLMLDQQALQALVADVKLSFSCELGQTCLSLEKLARLKPGQLLRLEGRIGYARLYAESFHTYLGWGEVVSCGPHFGLKLSAWDLAGALAAPATAREKDHPTSRVELKVLLGCARITLADLLGLQTGMILPLDQLTTQPLSLQFTNGVSLQGRVIVKQEELWVRLLDPDPPGFHSPLSAPSTSLEVPHSPQDLSAILKHADPALISLTLQKELPQTIAFILFRMDEYKASRVMKYLPQALQVEVTAKIVSLAQKAANHEFVEILANHFEHIADSEGPGKDVENQGINFAASMLNYSDKSIEEAVIQGLEKEYPELAESIKFRMFIFDDIRLLDNRAIQRILKELDTRDLAIALKSGSRELVRKIYQNMPAREGELLKQEIEFMGPVLRSEVEKAQAKIIDFIRILEENGELVIDRSGKEVV